MIFWTKIACELYVEPRKNSIEKEKKNVEPRKNKVIFSIIEK